MIVVLPVSIDLRGGEGGQIPKDAAFTALVSATQSPYARWPTQPTLRWKVLGTVGYPMSYPIWRLGRPMTSIMRWIHSSQKHLHVEKWCVSGLWKYCVFSKQDKNGEKIRMLGAICETHTISYPSSSNSLHVIKKDGFLTDVNAQGQRGRRKWKLDLENRKEDGQKHINLIVITI